MWSLLVAAALATDPVPVVVWVGEPRPDRVEALLGPHVQVPRIALDQRGWWAGDVAVGGFGRDGHLDRAAFDAREEVVAELVAATSDLPGMGVPVSRWVGPDDVHPILERLCPWRDGPFVADRSLWWALGSLNGHMERLAWSLANDELPPCDADLDRVGMWCGRDHALCWAGIDHEGSVYVERLGTGEVPARRPPTVLDFRDADGRFDRDAFARTWTVWIDGIEAFVDDPEGQLVWPASPASVWLQHAAGHGPAWQIPRAAEAVTPLADSEAFVDRLELAALLRGPAPDLPRDLADGLYVLAVRQPDTELFVAVGRKPRLYRWDRLHGTLVREPARRLRALTPDEGV